MKEMVILPAEVSVARNQSQQLKVIMNLPVRLISENQVIDVLPIEENLPLISSTRKRRILESTVQFVFPTPNQLIAFFTCCEFDDLMNVYEVASYYQVHPTTISSWCRKGILKRYRIAPNITFLKKSELPVIDLIYTIR